MDSQRDRAGRFLLWKAGLSRRDVMKALLSLAFASSGVAFAAKPHDSAGWILAPGDR